MPGDGRPYLEVDVFGFSITGLLDSGAMRTIVGCPGFDLLLQLGLKLTPRQSSCTVANGEICSSPGYIKTPITLKGRTRWIDILVVPSLPHRLILGIDFWTGMEVVPRLNEGVWHFSEAPVESEQVCSVTGESHLTPAQSQLLQSLVEEKFQRMGTGIGCANVPPHDIELLSGAKPIKQRWYPVSPAKQKIIDQHLKEMLDSGIIEPSRGHRPSVLFLRRTTLIDSVSIIDNLMQLPKRMHTPSLTYLRFWID